MKNIIRNLICSSVLFAASNMALAEVAVIVNPANGDSITKEDVQKIYLGKTKTFPGGQKAVALDQSEGSAVRVEFVTKVVDKDEAQMKAYWSRLIFTGRGVPPRVMASDADVRDAVSKNANAIGFIDVSAVNDKVKVVATF